MLRRRGPSPVLRVGRDPRAHPSAEDGGVRWRGLDIDREGADDDRTLHGHGRADPRPRGRGRPDAARGRFGRDPFWAAWIRSADRYTQAVGAELARLEDANEPTGDLTARLADHTRTYLREMTALPTVAVQHFNGELEKIGRPKPRRTRSARVKE